MSVSLDVLKQYEEQMEIIPYIEIQPQLTDRLICNLISRMTAIVTKLKFKPLTLHQAIYMLHCLLSKKKVSQVNLTCVGDACLYIACQFNETGIIYLSQYVCDTGKIYPISKIIDTIAVVFQAIGYNAFFPVPSIFISNMMHEEINEAESKTTNAESTVHNATTTNITSNTTTTNITSNTTTIMAKNNNTSSIEQSALFIARTIINHTQLICYKPSILAAACIYIARYTISNFDEISDLRTNTNDNIVTVVTRTHAYPDADITTAVQSILFFLNINIISGRGSSSYTLLVKNKFMKLAQLLIKKYGTSFLRQIEYQPDSARDISLPDMEEKICDLAINYQLLSKIGEGSFGSVYKAKNLYENQEIAIKKHYNDEEECITYTFIREATVLRILNKFPHPNLISNGCIIPSIKHMTVMPHTGQACGYEYKNIMARKWVMFQLLSAVAHLHKYGICHRDISTNNITTTSTNIITLLDYGSCRMFDLAKDNCKVSSPIVTLWFRPIELLLDYKYYGPAQDMWSVGCVLLFLIGCNIMGDIESDQIFNIFRLLGSPDANCKLRKLPLWKSTFPQYEGCINEKITDVIELDFVKRLLNYEYNARISAADALLHPYVKEFSH